VLLRLAYLCVTNVFALLRLLSLGDRDKETEILALRHQIAVLERLAVGQGPAAVPSGRPGVLGRPAELASAPHA
jgi:putative transposase